MSRREEENENASRSYRCIDHHRRVRLPLRPGLRLIIATAPQSPLFIRPLDRRLPS